MSAKKIYFSVNEVRRIVFDNGISKSSLMTMLHNGTIPCERFMNRYFVPCWWVDEQIAKATGKVSKNVAAEVAR